MSAAADLSAALVSAASAATRLINDNALTQLRIVQLTNEVNDLTAALDAATTQNEENPNG